MPAEGAWDRWRASGGAAEHGWICAGASCGPLVLSLLIGVIVALLIVGIGDLLLHLHPEEIISELQRPDLFAALGLAVLILVGGAFLSRPRAEERRLDEPVALGETPFFTPVAPPPTDEEATRRGPQGTWGDVVPGYTLYARKALWRSRRRPTRRGGIWQDPSRHPLRQRSVGANERCGSPSKRSTRSIRRPTRRSWPARVTKSSIRLEPAAESSAAARNSTPHLRRTDATYPQSG